MVMSHPCLSQGIMEPYENIFGSIDVCTDGFVVIHRIFCSTSKNFSVPGTKKSLSQDSCGGNIAMGNLVNQKVNAQKVNVSKYNRKDK